MKNISLNIDKVAGFVSKETIAAYAPQVKPVLKLWKTVQVKVMIS